MQRITLMVTGLWLFLGLSACSSLKVLDPATYFETPKVAVDEVRIQRLGMTDVELALDLTVTNPNAASFQVDGLHYRLMVNEQVLLSGTSETPTNIPAQGSGALALPVVLVYADVEQLAQSLPSAQSLEYRILIEVDIDVPVLGRQTIEVEHGHALPWPRPPRVHMANIQVKDMSWQGVELVLQLRVENPNAFAIDIRELAYRVTVADQTWLNSQLDEAVSLGANGEQTLEIPLTLSLLALGNGVLSLLQSEKGIPYEIRGNLTLDSVLPGLQNVQLPIQYKGQLGSTVD